MDCQQQYIQQRKSTDLSNESLFGGIQQQHQKKRTLTIDYNLEKKSLNDESEQQNISIYTFLSIANCKMAPKPTKTLRSFKENNTPQKEKKEKSQSIVHFMEPELLIKSLFQDHTLTIKMNQVKYFSSTKKGLRNFETLQNQDVILIERIANIFKLFAIFDGHGQYGKIVAQSSSYVFKKFLKSYEEQFKRQISEKQTVHIVKSCIKKTQAYLHNSKFNQIQYSGTTAIIVLITPTSIISFNIGNSRLVIGMKQQNGPNIYEFQVSHDHDLNRLDERLRVMKHGAVISPLKDQLGQSFGPDRLWNKNDKKPGTFITRALGLACGSKAGIICDPQISILTYNKRMKFMVLASDGLWCVEENDEVISYLDRFYRQGQLRNGVQSLMQEATVRWKSKTQLMDDVSIIAVSLTQQL